MPSERVQRVIDGYLDEIEVAVRDGRWNNVSELANTILELDDTNDDAQTFLKLAVSKSGSQETHSVDGFLTIDDSLTDKAEPTPKSLGGSNLTREKYHHIWDLRVKSDGPYTSLDRFLQASDQELIDIVVQDLQSAQEVSGSWWLGIWGSPYRMEERLHLTHLLLTRRKQDMPKNWVSPDRSSVVDSLQQWFQKHIDGTPYSIDELSHAYFEYESSLKRSMVAYVDGAYNEFSNPSVTSQKTIEPITEPTSDYWETRQKLTSLEDQDLETSSSSTPTKRKVASQSTDDEQNWGWLIVLLLISAVAGYVVFFLVQLIISSILLSSGADTTGPYLISVILSIVSGIATGVFVFKRFKS